ncbi:MoaD family protein [Archaeoglobus fulgidus]|uniref:MoaD family protein, archaeal n=1 Tax=Archaeoglobus fulgidus DSM 8774 TaxID=1344584 RepID=A0A075WAE8_ARCFL|nr:MoaD family protein [Archaeoglobus fulgidus]AIG97370.1 MoaD family protein, archaeal [Archaeoglobus fulgidus DSM 8774]
MAIKVRLPASINQGELEIDAEKLTVNQLIALLSQITGKDLEKILKRDGELSPFISIFVNGRNVRYAEGLETEVRSGDEVSIVPTVAGG